MAIIRVTRELLEYALDLPEGVKLTGTMRATKVDDIDVFELEAEGASDLLPEATGTYGLAYEEAEDGLHLVSAVPLQ